jgi:hypothetical protein
MRKDSITCLSEWPSSMHYHNISVPHKQINAHTSMMLLCDQLAICIPSPCDHTLLHTAAAAAAAAAAASPN